MGSCISQGPQNRRSQNQRIYNPMYITPYLSKKIINDYSISHLNSKWDKKQIEELQSKNKLSLDKPINFNNFLHMFPKLSNLSIKIQHRYFQLLAYEGKTQISSKELMNSLTIIRKVSANSDFAPLIFFVYTSDPKHQKMEEEQLKLFEQKNKDNAKNLILLDSQDEQLIQNDQFKLENIDKNPNTDRKNGRVLKKRPSINMNRTLRAQKIIVEIKSSPSSSHTNLNNAASKKPEKTINEDPLNQNPIKKTILLNKFIQIFENYNLKSYQLLFSWNIEEQQRDLAMQISNQGLSNKKDDKVYLIQYQWFLQWRQYIFNKYNIQLRENIKADYNTQMRIKSMNESGLKKPSSNIKSLEKKESQSNKHEKPGIINNSILIQNKKGRFLIQNLVQNTHYICVKQYIWNQLIAIYNGGPFIQRIYPVIYYNTVIKVYVNQNGVFKPNEIKRFDNKKQKIKVKDYASQSETKYSCYYKYPGKTNWILMQNMQKKSEQVFNSSRTYLVFVPPQSEKDFKLHYNMYQVDKQIVMNQRLKNYGSHVNVYVQGVLTIAEVVQIIDKNSITIEYTSQNGNTKKQKMKIDEQFKSINPQQLSQDQKLNQLAGILNIGNSCYLNAVIQCLIRTPYFGGYLDTQKFIEDQSKDHLLLKQISLIYKQSKQGNIQPINPKELKKIFSKIYPYFEGNNQHDAQEFLNNFLSRILEEINSKKQEYGMRPQSMKIEKKQDTTKNQKINKFFSGQTKAETFCTKCKNRGQKIEPFFTYSISLSQIKEMEFHYFYFRHNQTSKTMTPEKYGITLNRKINVEQFQKAVSKQLNLPLQKVFFCTLFNNEILHRIDQHQSYRQILYYLHFNTKLAIFQVNYKANPTYDIFKSKLLKQTSIKIELKHRIYSSKMKEYKFIFMPNILEIYQTHFWKDVILDIHQNIEKLNKKSVIQDKQNNQNSHTPMFDSVRVISHRIQKREQLVDDVRFSLLKEPQKKINGEIISQTNKSIKSKYSIRVIKSDHYYQNFCIFCKEEFHPIKYIKKPKICKGECGFKNDTELFNQKQFRNIYDNIIITIDWQQISPDIQQYTNHPSFYAAVERSQKRKDNIQTLIENNLKNEETLELTCQKKRCLYTTASRRQKIQVYPNILLLHLKRFTYEDNMLVKLTNNVIYPELLVLNNKKQQYELYGVVCHIGNGVGGHYISYVRVNGKWYRCDDHKVTHATAFQHIDPNAYLLFYKKIDFEPSLKTLSIR